MHSLTTLTVLLHINSLTHSFIFSQFMPLLQGIVGSTPWNAMVFFTLWLQLLGFTDYSASVLMALFAGGCAIGSALGGYLGELTP